MIYLYNNEPVPDRIFRILDSYLDGINDDGVCLEGLSYWSYGFGYYMYFAKLLKERTGKDIISNDKIRATALFQQNMYLGGNEFVSCSDSQRICYPLKGLTGLLCEMFPNEVFSPCENTVRTDDCDRWAHYIRSYLYKPVFAEREEAINIYNTSQWYTAKKPAYSFFIKGGSNDEPHNHNDVGSFIIADNSGQLICDIGSGEYTGDYFNDNTRYSYLCNSSLGHNLPIIDGEGQKHGKKYLCTEFKCVYGYISMRIGAAYGSGTDIFRRLYLHDDKITLRDSFSFDDGKTHDITERFITTIKPIIHEDKTEINDLSISGVGEVHEHTINDHSGKPLKVYTIDFKVHNNEFKTEFRL